VALKASGTFRRLWPIIVTVSKTDQLQQSGSTLKNVVTLLLLVKAIDKWFSGQIHGIMKVHNKYKRQDIMIRLGNFVLVFRETQ
jgi:hypothetical protein